MVTTRPHSRLQSTPLCCQDLLERRTTCSQLGPAFCPLNTQPAAPPPRCVCHHTCDAHDCAPLGEACALLVVLLAASTQVVQALRGGLAIAARQHLHRTHTGSSTAAHSVVTGATTSQRSTARQQYVLDQLRPLSVGSPMCDKQCVTSTVAASQAQPHPARVMCPPHSPAGACASQPHL